MTQLRRYAFLCASPQVTCEIAGRVDDFPIFGNFPKVAAAVIYRYYNGEQVDNAELPWINEPIMAIPTANESLQMVGCIHMNWRSRTSRNESYDY